MFMPPNQVPSPGQNPYEFFLNPAAPSKVKLAGKLPLPKDPFLRRVAIVVGGGVVLIIAVIILATVIFGGASAPAGLLGIAQDQNELIRISTNVGEEVTAQTTKNLAVNAELILTTEQQQLVTYAGQHGQKISTKQLTLTKNTATDTQLTNAQAASNLDAVYIQITQSQLTAYRTALKQAFDATTSSTARQLLSTDYSAAATLLTQAGSAATSLQGT